MIAQNNAFDYLLSKLDEARQHHAQFLSGGGASDYADYCRLCGVIQGLDTAKNLISDLAKRLEEDPDE